MAGKGLMKTNTNIGRHRRGTYSRPKRANLARLAAAGLGLVLLAAASATAGGLADLARPHDGRSMRATSSHRIGPDGKYDPKGELDPNSNRDNQSVPPGETKVLLEADGPGVITHMWITFLGPEPHPWAKTGSATHQEMLLRIYYDGDERPGVEAPVGDFFANCFGERREVISVPVVVEDADSYNCFWHMPFRKSVRIEIVNQSEKRISTLARTPANSPVRVDRLMTHSLSQGKAIAIAGRPRRLHDTLVVPIKLLACQWR